MAVDEPPSPQDDPAAALSDEKAAFREVKNRRVLFQAREADRDTVAGDTDDDSDGSESDSSGQRVTPGEAAAVATEGPTRLTAEDIRADPDACVREWCRRLVKLRVESRMTEKVALALTEAVDEVFGGLVADPVVVERMPRTWDEVKRRWVARVWCACARARLLLCPAARAILTRSRSSVTNRARLPDIMTTVCDDIIEGCPVMAEATASGNTKRKFEPHGGYIILLTYSHSLMSNDHQTSLYNDYCLTVYMNKLKTKCHQLMIECH